MLIQFVIDAPDTIYWIYTAVNKTYKILYLKPSQRSCKCPQHPPCTATEEDGSLLARRLILLEVDTPPLRWGLKTVTSFNRRNFLLSSLNIKHEHDVLPNEPIIYIPYIYLCVPPSSLPFFILFYFCASLLILLIIITANDPKEHLKKTGSVGGSDMFRRTDVSFSIWMHVCCMLQ